MTDLNADDSLEEGEIPSPPPSPAPRKSRYHSSLVPHGWLPPPKTPQNTKKKRKRRGKIARLRQKVQPIKPTLDFDYLRSVHLEKLVERKQIESVCVNMPMEDISDVEMEDSVPPLIEINSSPEKLSRIIDDDDDFDLEQLRARALQSQQTPNKTVEAVQPAANIVEPNEFSLRADALKSAILKKRRAIIQKKKMKNSNLKVSIENSKNVNANLGNQSPEIIKSPEVVVNISPASSIIEIENVGKEKNSDGKENIDTDAVDEILLRQQLLATIATRKKQEDKSPPKNVNTVNEIAVKELESRVLNKLKAMEQIEKSQSTKSNKNNSLETLSKTILDQKIILNKLTNCDKQTPAKIPKIVQSSIVPGTSNADVTKKYALNNVVAQRKLPPKINVTQKSSERIVIRLGAESSDDDEPPTKTNTPRVNPLINSVDQFLLDARKRIEEAAPPTPEAVHAHLPPSQRLEYMRLKRKLAEKEKLIVLKSGRNSSPNNSKSTNLIVTNEIKKPPATDVLKQPASPLSKETEPVDTPKKISLDTVVKEKIEPPKPSTSIVLNNNSSTNKVAADNAKIEQMKTLIRTNVQVARKMETPKTAVSLVQLPTRSQQLKKQKEELDIHRAKQLMILLRKEMAQEKSSREELARLRLQMSYIEHKRMAHATKAATLRVRIKRLLGRPRKSISLDDDKTKEMQMDNKLVKNNKLETNKATTVLPKVETRADNMKMADNKKVAEDKVIGDTSDKSMGSFVDYKSPLSKTICTLDPLKEVCPHQLTGLCRDPECSFQHVS